MLFFGVIFVGCLLFHVYTLNASIKYYNSIEAIPIFKASIIASNIICAGIILNEFSHYALKDLAYLSLGVGISVVGILIIMKKGDLAKEESRDDSSFIRERSIKLV
eukprot:CAMPEP_0170544356 /NCGR_PEP_ID=MMETSP0211-20121228/3147_1 /TAXON_ID=311385 /ORGANISM="Pseudokeronopsis sp., Strain OXSARD2" /LENGTH=105 /DNA_ID=CAMNT_0010847983 /DNA_START=977 /DNA_END=1294 /DNA_ORIENTATION=-